MNTATDLTPREKAELLLDSSRNIPNFIYYGGFDLGNRAAMVFPYNPSSSLIDRSNHEVIAEDLTKQFPDDVAVEEMRHWLVGWVRWILVNVLDEDGDLSPAGAAVLTWMDRLEEYPVADDEHLSQLEREEMIEIIRLYVGGLADDEAEQVLDVYLERGHEPTPEYLDVEAADEIAQELGFIEEDDE